MKRFIFMTWLVVGHSVSYCQELETNPNAGAITSDILDRVEFLANVDPIKMKFISQHGTSKISEKNDDLEIPLFHDHIIDVGKVHDQKQSGRCWIFSEEKLFSQALRAKWGSDFSFSQSFIAFWDKFERANFIMNEVMSAAVKRVPLNDYELKAVINLAGDGGEWTFFKNIVRKYGLVPAQAMKETNFSGNSSGYTDLIKEEIIQCSVELYKNPKQEYKEKCLANVYKILVYYLGEPPKTVLWPIDKEKKVYQYLTPKDFLDMSKIELDDYVHISHLPHLNENGLVLVTNVGNVWESERLKTVSVSMQLLKNAYKNSILADIPVPIGTSIKGLNHQNNLFSLSGNKTRKILGLDSIKICSKEEGLLCGRDRIDHGMIGIGIRLHSDDSEFPMEFKMPEHTRGELFLVQNSWGEDSSKLFMTSEWIDRYVYSVLVHKDFVPFEVYEKYINESAEDVIFIEATDPFALVTTSNN